MNQDAEHLKLLSIFHYVLAGIIAFLSCIPFIHFFMGLAIATGVIGGTDDGAQVVGVIFMIGAGIFILTGWTLASLVFCAGRNLAKRSRYTFCLVIAGLECMFMPFGTVLGVFTIIVLMRESVKPLFSHGSGTIVADPGTGEP